MKKEIKSKKRKVLLSLDEDTIQLLEKGSKELGINKSSYITRLLKDNVENRLSKYIVRDVENLLLYLILQNPNLKKIDKENLINKLDEIYKETKIIKQSKTILLKEEREKRKSELKNFWNKILKLLEPKTFMNKISTNGKLDQEKTKKFIIELRDIIKENKNLWNK
jgi:hypothetical protein